jgi:hypothetical protein
MGRGGIVLCVWERALCKFHQIIQHEGLEHWVEMCMYSQTIILAYEKFIIKVETNVFQD